MDLGVLLLLWNDALALAVFFESLLISISGGRYRSKFDDAGLPSLIDDFCAGEVSFDR